MRGWHWLLREWRGGRSADISILFFALFMSVAIVAGIGLFGERLQRALDAQATTYLAGDLALSSGYAIPAEIDHYADSNNIQIARTTRFGTMAYPKAEDGDGILVEVKGVSTRYPLKGELEYTYGQGYAPGANALHIVPTGTALVAQQYLDRAQLSIGDQIYVGDLLVRIIGTIDREPDQGFSTFSYGPRVLINSSDVLSTMAVRKGSRVTYAHQYSGDDEAISAFKLWLKDQLNEDIRLSDLNDGQPQLANTLKRAKEFLLLCGALGVALAGVAMALAGRRYSRYLLDAVAVKKTLGATPRKITALLAEKLFSLWLVATAAGLIAAFVLQALIANIVSAWVSVELPSPTPVGALLGIVTSAVSLLAFLGPPILQLRSVPPLRVIRRELGNVGSVGAATIIGTLSFVGLLWLYTSSLWIALGLLGALIVALLLASVLALGVLRNRGARIQASSPWRLAISALRRHRWLSVAQIAAFAMTLTLFSVAVLVRTDLIDQWQDTVPENAPNHFFINIADYQVENMAYTFNFEAIDNSRLYPMVRGRIVKINGEDAKTRAQEQGYRYVRRELNLSYADQLPLDNEIVGGHWWEPEEVGAYISIEDDFAADIGVSIGDTLTINIGGQDITATILSLRSLDWNDLRPAFFVILHPSLLEDFGATWMTSAYVPEARTDFLPRFLREFPTVTVIDVGYIVKQVREVISQVTQAVELVLSLVGVSALLVLVATIRSSQDWRMRESAVLRALGAGQNRLLGALIIEFAILGFLAGILAAFMAESSVAVIQIMQFEESFRLHPTLWLVLPIFSTVLVTLFGVFSARSVVKVPPSQLLRELN